MIAVDHNALVGLLTRDDEGQFQATLRFFRNEEIFIAKTVVLECEWVLRHASGLDAQDINKALQSLFGLANVELEAALEVATAVAWHSQGLDFADTLHLAASRSSERFATFDNQLISGGAEHVALAIGEP